jgi:DNA (cytosine-5)-methyltransferase 1
LDKSFADFFAGIGLMRIGLERQAWSFAFANDIDEQKKKMYKGNFLDAEGHYQCRDIHLLSVDDIPTVSLATASFPCNDLSLAGARDGLRGKHSSAFWGFIKTLEKMGSRRPPLVLLENVPGFLTSHKGKDFRDALLALNQLGYVVDAFLLNAMRFVPQSRSRLFVVGLRDDDGSDGAGQTPAILPSEIRPKALADFIHAHSEIHWRIRTLPALPKGGKTLVDVLDDLPPDASEWWSKERVEYLFDQMSLRHRKMADEMARKRKWSYGTVFRRMRNETSMAELRTDGIAGCLRTPRGGSGRQILLKAGYGKYFVRLLTPRECARLMGANGYKISVPLNQALFGFGDAVCVPVIEWIAKHYLNPVVDELNQNCTALQPA